MQQTETSLRISPDHWPARDQAKDEVTLADEQTIQALILLLKTCE